MAHEDAWRAPVNQAFRPNPRRVAVPLMGALASFSLHVLLLTHVLLGPWTPVKRQIETQGTGPSIHSSSDESPMIATILEESDDPPNFGHSSIVTATMLTARDGFVIPDVQPTSVIAVPDPQLDKDGASMRDGDNDPGQALMFGRYVGQISARIDRAWIKPRTPVPSGRFACRARILQDHKGVVREIELEGCNGDSQWQMSLVQAIQSASPLPAPPDPGVFAGTLQIELTADPFVPGGNSEGFEPEPERR
jgi:hypothetical protein